MFSASAWRLSTYYGAQFAAVGVFVAYWPVYLQHRGLTAAEIGLLLSAGLWAKVVANPLLAQWADRRGLRRQPMTALALAVLVGYVLFPLADGFVQMLLLAVFCTVAFSAIMPLGESAALSEAQVHKLDYGRLRLWGSITFIATTWAGGFYLADFGAGAILWAVLALMALVVMACTLMPTRVASSEPAAAGPPLLLLLKQPVFLLFMLAVSCLQASHAVLYGFGTLHWRASGIADGMIGFLWAEGVIAEIVLFFAGAVLLRRLGIPGLLMLGAAAGLIRWTAYAVSDALWLALTLQGLHAFTFGATHLGAMHFITRAVPPAWSASAQSLYTAVSGGLITGLATGLAGPLYAAVGGQAFFMGSLLSAIGLVLAMALARCWDGGRLDRTTGERQE